MLRIPNSPPGNVHSAEDHRQQIEPNLSHQKVKSCKGLNSTRLFVGQRCFGCSKNCTPQLCRPTAGARRMPKPVLRRSVRATNGTATSAAARPLENVRALPRSSRNIAITWPGLSPQGKANRICTIRQFARGRDGHPETDAVVIAYSLATAMLLAERTRLLGEFSVLAEQVHSFIYRAFPRCALFQGDLAHELAAQDLANLHALGRCLPLLVG
jgi:hypothetical protein